MKNAKKLLSLFLALTLTVLAFSLYSCAKPSDKPADETTGGQTEENKEVKPESIRVITLAGPTGMGMAKLIDDDKNNKTKYNYEFTVASAPDQVNPEVLKGNYDIACVPVNLASVLYSKTKGELQVAGVNTLGVLYLLENGSTIKSVADLKGKTIYATGQGSNPEYVLRYILTKNNIDPDKDVKIEFLADHAELATKLKLGEVSIGMLPEPQVTSATMGNDKLKIALDLTEEWSKVADYKLVQGCIIVNKAFAKDHPTALKDFLDEYKTSVDFVNNNIEDASKLIEAAGIVPKAAIAKAAIPNCNICLVTGKDMKASVKGMLTVLFEANKSSVGGELPNDEFYYE